MIKKQAYFLLVLLVALGILSATTIPYKKSPANDVSTFTPPQPSAQDILSRKIRDCKELGSVDEVRTCLVKEGVAINPDSTGLNFLCEDPVLPGGILKKQYKLNADQDAEKETFVACGYDHWVAGVGADFPIYLIDDNGTFIKNDLDVGGEGAAPTAVYDVDGDGIDEILITSYSCVTGYGCYNNKTVYSLKYKKAFTETTEERDFEGGEQLKNPVITTTYRGDVTIPQNQFFLDFLKNDFATVFKSLNQ